MIIMGSELRMNEWSGPYLNDFLTQSAHQVHKAPDFMSEFLSLPSPAILELWREELIALLSNDQKIEEYLVAYKEMSGHSGCMEHLLAIWLSMHPECNIRHMDQIEKERLGKTFVRLMSQNVNSDSDSDD